MKRTMNMVPLLIALSLFFSVQVSADEPFKVGLSFPLSGALAEFGAAARNGVELARVLHSKDFEKVSFVYEDNQFDPKIAISSFHRFVERDGVSLVYVWGSPVCMAVAPIAETSKVPLTCLSGDPKPGLKHVFSYNSMAPDYAAVALADVHARGAKKIALLYAGIPFMTNIARAILASQAAGQADILDISINPDATDLRSEILKIKAARPDFLMLFILPSQVQSIAREMALLKFKPYILGADTFSDGSIVSASNGLFAGAPYVDMLIPAGFRKDYQEKYQNTSNLSFAYNTYRFARMVAALFPSGGKISSDTVLKKLRSYQGAGESPEANISFQDSPENGQYFQFPIGLSFVPAASKDEKTQ